MGNSTEQNNLPKGMEQKSEKIYFTARCNWNCYYGWFPMLSMFLKTNCDFCDWSSPRRPPPPPLLAGTNADGIGTADEGIAEVTGDAAEIVTGTSAEGKRTADQ